MEEILNSIREYLKDNQPKYLHNNNFIAGKSQVLYSGMYWDDKEITAMISAIMTGKWFVSGEHVHKFENQFSKKFGHKYSHMVNSGSSANLVMIGALKKYFNWADGDEIIVSPVGFPTSISVLVQNNLKPVFIDIEFDTLNFDITKIEEKITDKTRGIFISPVLGNAPDMDYLKQLCDRYNIQMIGDNCDSLGSKWDNKFLTDYYVASSCSFYPAHHLSLGEGGSISTNIEEIQKTAFSLSHWGRCLPYEGTVYTNKGIKKIGEITLDDVVYTHKGNYKKVSHLFKSDYTGIMYKFKSKKSLDCEFTSEHPLYIERNGSYDWIEAKDIKVGDNLVMRIPDEKETPETITFKYNTLVKQEEFTVKVEPDLFRLIGYWLAEGSLAKDNKGSNGKNKPSEKDMYLYYIVEFTFHEKEVDYIEDVKILMKKYFNTTGWVETRKDSKGIALKFKSRRAYEFLYQYCNKISYEKKMHNDFLHYNKECIIEVLKGYWRGDGSTVYAAQHIYTTSLDLFHQFKFMLSRLGIVPSIHIRTPEKHTPIIVNNLLVTAKHDLYSLKIHGKDVINFSNMINEPSPVKKLLKNNDKFISDDSKYTLHQITEIIENEVRDFKVYNFEVEDDNSYHAYGIASHNCCHCVGSANLLPCGTCGNRFDKWLKDYDGIVDHRYVFDNMGYNLKPLDLQGAIGIEQLKKFDEIETKRKISKDRIESILTKYVSGIKGVKSLPKADTCWFGTPFVCESKELKRKLVDFLEQNRIQTRNYFAGNILIHEGYKHLDDFKQYPNANKVLDTVFFLGASPHYNEEIFEYVDSVFRDKWIN